MPTSKNLKPDPRLGALRDKKDSRDYKFSAVFPDTPSVPPVVDWEPSLSPIKDQGRRGSCVSFASAATKEWQEGHQRVGKGFDLSESFIYEQIRQPGGGSYPRDAMMILKDMGICLEKLLPYDPKKDDKLPKDFDPKKNRRAIGNARNYRIEAFSRLGSHNDIMQALAFSGPVIVAMIWQEEWMKVKNEPSYLGYPILKWEKNGEIAGRHCFVICGYDNTDPNKPLYKIRNSWGTTWGKKGYVFIEQAAIWKAQADVWVCYDRQNPLVSTEGEKKESKKKA